jgi:site-specific DNA recombinase
MIRAALYLRKSNAQEKGASGDSLSIERQRHLAQAFAESKGWTVDPAHIFVDDALSGTDFTNRHGLVALLSAAEKKPREYDLLVMMDESRLGRDQFKTGYVLQRLSDAGVRVWFYQDAREAQLDTAIGKFMESVRGFGSELHVEKIRANTREGERATARSGHVAGGVPAFGYLHAKDGPKTILRVHVEHAAVVKTIFALAADGKGPFQIAGALNAMRLPSPRGGEWSRSTIVSLLRNEQYTGKVVYGRHKIVRQGGVRKQVPAPETEWIIRHDEALRLVSDVEYQAAHAQMAKSGALWAGFRSEKGKLSGRPEGQTTSAHLLGGLLRCGECGSVMVPTSRASAKGMRRHYVCQRRYKQGGRCPVTIC